MRKDCIVLDNSWLAQNIYRSILQDRCLLESALHMADIDVLLGEGQFGLLIVSEGSFSIEEWNLVRIRNPALIDMKKIFIGDGKYVPDGFLLLKRPFGPAEFLRLVVGKEPALKTAKRHGKRGTINIYDRRIFQRNSLNIQVYFLDELGRPLVYLNAKDISLGGVFLEGTIFLRTGSMAYLSFKLDGKELFITAEVVRTHGGGMGLRFMGLSDEAESSIRSYVEKVISS